MIHNLAIGFSPDLVPLILNRSKELTYRLGDKYNFLEVGDRLNLKDSSTDEIFGQIEIIQKSHTTFKELPINGNGHEIYASNEEKYETFKKYYGRNIDDAERVLILRFKLIK